MKEQKPYEEGSILTNAPEHFKTMEELAEIALSIDKQRWKREANAIKHGSIGEHSSSSMNSKPNDSIDSEYDEFMNDTCIYY